MNLRAARLNPSRQQPGWIHSAFQLAVRCQSGGWTEQAKQLYGMILLACPEHPEALHNLALLAARDREYALAGELCTRLIGSRARLTLDLRKNEKRPADRTTRRPASGSNVTVSLSAVRAPPEEPSWPGPWLPWWPAARPRPS